MTSSSDFSLMRSPPKMLSLVGVFDACTAGGGDCCCVDGGGGVKLRCRVPTDARGAVPCGSPPTITAGRATTTPSAVGLPPPYGWATPEPPRRPPMPVTGARGAGAAGCGACVPVRDADTGIAGRDGVRLGRDGAGGRMICGAFVVDAGRAGGGSAGTATRGGGCTTCGTLGDDGSRVGIVIDGSVFGAASNSPEMDAPGSV